MPSGSDSPTAQAKGAAMWAHEGKTRTRKGKRLREPEWNAVTLRENCRCYLRLSAKLVSKHPVTEVDIDFCGMRCNGNIAAWGTRLS